MSDWQACLRFDPLPALLASSDPPLVYFTRHDLLDEDPGPLAAVWDTPGAQRLLKRQQPDGDWRYPGKPSNPVENYRLVETWKQFRYLVEVYGFNRQHPAASRAAEFLFSCQAAAGDFRGFIANQYATYYTGALLSLLIKAGYEDDPRVEKGMQWLLTMRQDDLGWTIPVLTHDFPWDTVVALTSQEADPVEPIRSKPFSHNWTGMVLRAFAAHSRYRRSPAAYAAAQLLKSRFFQPDVYSSYQAASYWVRFQYPFWWNNLVAALDSITLIDPTLDPALLGARDWLVEHQGQDGLWKATYVPGKAVDSPNARVAGRWVSLAICRVLRRLDRSSSTDTYTQRS